MARTPDSKQTITQAQFDRLTGTTRDDWRKWEKRRLVKKLAGGYAWPQIVEAIALRALELSAGLEAVVQCWEDVHEALLRQIHQNQLDLIFDPGTGPATRPRMRAFLSTDDSSTAERCRAARTPHVLPLAGDLADARSEFERIVARTLEHASTSQQGGSNGAEGTARSSDGKSM